MGGVASTFSRGDLAKVEEKPQILMNRILNYILTGISDNDVFKMQDPESCKNFLMLSTDSLKHLFAEINLFPMEKRGKIYFARVSELTQPKRDPALKEYLGTICLSIGYFYVRIVQIFAALALTIIDDQSISAAGAGAFTYRPATGAPRPPGFRGGGGGPLDDLVSLGVLTSDQRGNYKVRSRSTDSSGLEVYVIDSGSRHDGGQVTGYKQESLTAREKKPIAAAFTFRISGQKLIIQRIQTPGGDRRDNFFQQPPAAQYYPGYYPGYAAGRVSKPDVKTINVQIELTSDYALVTPYDGKTTNIGSFFRALLIDLENRRTRPIEEYEKAVVEEEDDRLGVQRVARGTLPFKTTGRVPELDLAPSLAALKDTRPVAHCIARSMQLLNADMMTTNICNNGFIGRRGELPDGRAITAVPGIGTLSMLFFVFGKTIGLTQRTSAELELALNLMSKAFEEPPGHNFTGAQLRRESMSAIRGRVTRKCGSRRSTGTLDKADAAKARSGASALLSYQAQHVQKVDALFRQMFAVDSMGSIAFHPNLLARGIPEVERIGAMARTLLVEYYTRCEARYQSTVEDIKIGGLAAGGAQPVNAIYRPPRADAVPARGILRRPVY
jgi:hypothetical protein